MASAKLNLVCESFGLYVAGVLVGAPVRLNGKAGHFWQGQCKFQRSHSPADAFSKF